MAKTKELQTQAASRVEVRDSGIHGKGLFAVEDIGYSERVIEYVGEKITKAESERRAWAHIEVAKKTGDAQVYIFVLNKKYDIDGNIPENDARLINHSCDPNCEALIIRGRIWITALRDIQKGEELYFNYNFDLENYEDHPCYCGSPHCVGYIAGEEYWPKLKKLIRKKEKEAAEAKKKKKKKKKKAKAKAKPDAKDSEKGGKKKKSKKPKGKK